MDDLPTVAAFAGASLLLLLVPGPAVLYVVTRTAHLGWRRGLVATLGVECGTLVHVLAAAVGLTALLAESPTAFAVVKWAGAAYLLLLGLRQLLRRTPAGHGGAGTVSTTFWQGVLVEALNPKTALFFLAFLPQFVDPSAGSPAIQLALLGLVFVAMAVLVDSSYAAVAGLVHRVLVVDGHGARWMDRASGLAHVGLAALAATARHAA